MVDKTDSLAKKYIEYVGKSDRGELFNDFFDWADVDDDLRSDFLIACTMLQVAKIRTEDNSGS